VEHIELVVLFLLVAVAVLTALARVLGLPYPILLVIGGSLVGFAPGVPDVQLDPDLVLLIFLPPLLFNAAYFSSVRDLRYHARAITLTSIGLVLLTMCSVALVAHAAIDGLPWPRPSRSARSCRPPIRWRRWRSCGGWARRAGSPR